MDVIKLNDKDVAILYCMPKVPCELINIIRNYTSINRDAPPSFDELTSFISKVIRAGIISESCDIYTVNEEWNRKIHFYDDKTKNEIDSMLLFEESIVGVELPVVSDSIKFFSREDYGMAVSKISEAFRENYRRIKGL